MLFAVCSVFRQICILWFVFYGVNTTYLWVNYRYNGTLVYCRARSMQMLSVQFFEITHKRKGDFFFNTSFTRSAFWSDMKYRILFWVYCRPFSHLRLLVRSWLYELLCRVVFLSLETIWFLDYSHIWHAYMRWKLNR